MQTIVLHITITTFFILILPTYAFSEFQQCNTIASCGFIKNITYPFYGGSRPAFCGRQGFELTCPDEDYGHPNITINNHPAFLILEIDTKEYTMKIARADTWDNECSTDNLFNATLDIRIFNYSFDTKMISLFYNCSSIQHQWEEYALNCSHDHHKGFFWFEGIDPSHITPRPVEPACESFVEIPVMEEFSYMLAKHDMELHAAVNGGFNVEYSSYKGECDECRKSQGICGSVPGTQKFVCYCRDGPHGRGCNDHDGINRKEKIIIAISFTVITGVIIMSILCYIITRNKKNCAYFLRKETKNEQDLEDFIKKCGPLPLRRYSYTEVKKMTNSFKDKLGQGGYGSVYRGKLADGDLVAVKVKNPSKGNGQEFINEVGSISKTSHVNIVNLLGFCLEGQKRALIYEFLPNGSLEKFVHNGSASTESPVLGWEKLYHIAIGIGRGLDYLHRGCKTRILHFDIKPHNILLDKDFCPKISDFGLAKLYTKKESIISMLEARGTIGYIAPEVFCRNFGGVSHKSDVYSYGMMILEMVGQRKNITVDVDYSSELYFPHWIYKQLEIEENYRYSDAITDEENEVARKMIIVGLWCILTNPADRPSMGKVIEMLEGGIEDLAIPPKPVITSPARSVKESSMASTTG